MTKYKFIKDFFYIFIPRLLGGGESKKSFSTTRLSFLGAFTAAWFYSLIAVIAFIDAGEYQLLLILCISWEVSAILTGGLLPMKDRVKILDKILERKYLYRISKTIKENQDIAKQID